MNNVKIGITAPAQALDVSGSVQATTTNSSALVGISTQTGTAGTGTGLYLQGATTGTGSSAMAYYNTTLSAYQMFMYANGNIVNTNNSYGGISDARLKENISDAPDYLESLNQVKIKQFSFISEHMDHADNVGVIAQELEKIFPEMVNTGSDGYKSVAYSKFVPLLVKSVQELYAKFLSLVSVQDEQARSIASIQADAAAKDLEIKRLQQENNDMKIRLERLENAIQSK